MLKSGVCLHLQRGAVLQFSGAIEDYLPAVFTRYEGLELMGLGGLIYAHKQKRIAITGEGELRGPESGPVRKMQSGLSDQLVNPDSELADRVFDGQDGRVCFRPYFVCLVECCDVLLEGVTFKNGPMWNVVLVYCDGVVLRGVYVDSRGVVNGDGFNVDSSRNVLIEYCSANTGDDCYAVKAGRNRDGLRVGRPAENIVVRHCLATGGFGGFTCGSETAGGIRNIHLHDCVFSDVRHAVYFKTRRPRGGGGESILAERLTFTCTNHAVFFDMIGSPLYVGDLGNRLPKRPLTPATPYYRNVTVRDVRGVSTEGEAFKIKGIPESPARDVLLERANISSRDFVNLNDAEGVTVVDCQLESQHPVLKLLDVNNVQFVNCHFVTPTSQTVRVEAQGSSLRSLRFENCDPATLRDCPEF